MASFLDGFASSFTNSFSAVSGARSERRRLAEQQRQFDTSHALEEEKWDVQQPAIEAETARTREQTEGLRFENDPAQRDLRTRASEAAIDKVYGDIRFQEENIPLIREEVKKAVYANTPEQRELANAELKAKTDALVASGRLAQSQADEINARIPLLPDVIQGEIDAKRAETGKVEAETEGLRQENEIGAGKVEIKKRLMEKWGLPFSGEKTTPAPEGAIPTERPPEPETTPFSGEWQEQTPGPTSQAIPEDGGAIQQASLRTPPSAGEGGGGNVIESQSGTRRLPLNDKTRQMLEDAAAAVGVDVQVTSGGQPSHGKNRTGSHRHDTDVGAADIKLIDLATGKPLSMAVPAEQARIANFVRAARAAGATGIGAGREYMGDTTIHVGFGTEAVWGAGGSGKNAPGWLVEAFNNPSGAVGTHRAPTPRGETGIIKASTDGKGVNRQTIAQAGTTAGREGLKAIYAGMQFGAVPDQNSQTQLRGALSGQGAASSQSMANAHQAVQSVLPKGTKISEAERNLATLGMAYEWALYVDEDPAKAQIYATEILQSYRQKATEYMSFSKALAESGRLDDAAKAAAKAYAYIPDGQEAKFAKGKDGNYTITTVDIATGEEVSSVIVPPNELFAKIMQWSPVDFDRRLRAAAGVAVPSQAYEQGAAQLSQGIPEVTSQGNVPQAIPIPSPVNIAEMSTEEATRYQAGRTEQLGQIEKRNEMLQPPDPTSREDTNEELAKLDEGMSIPPEVVTEMKTAFGDKFYGVASSMLQSNPTAIMEGIVADLRTTLNTAQSEEGLPFEVKNGDYVGMKKIRLGANEYNVPANVAATIINSINNKLRGDVQGRVTGAVGDYKSKLRRGITAAQTERLQGSRRGGVMNNPDWRRDMSRGVIPTQ